MEERRKKISCTNGIVGRLCGCFLIKGRYLLQYREGVWWQSKKERGCSRAIDRSGIFDFFPQVAGVIGACRFQSERWCLGRGQGSKSVLCRFGQEAQQIFAAHRDTARNCWRSTAAVTA